MLSSGSIERVGGVKKRTMIHRTKILLFKSLGFTAQVVHDTQLRLNPGCYPNGLIPHMHDRLWPCNMLYIDQCKRWSTYYSATDHVNRPVKLQRGPRLLVIQEDQWACVPVHGCFYNKQLSNVASACAVIEGQYRRPDQGKGRAYHPAGYSNSRCISAHCSSI